MCNFSPPICFFFQVMEAQTIVASKDVPIEILQRKIQSAKTSEEKEQYEKQILELMQVTCVCLSELHIITQIFSPAR